MHSTYDYSLFTVAQIGVKPFEEGMSDSNAFLKMA